MATRSILWGRTEAEVVIHFWKLSGAGNDFVGLDNRSGWLPEDGRRELFASWCKRGPGIGADGVLVLEPARKRHTQFTMRYYNADGGEGEMCGNGARCIARLAHHLGAAGEEMSFDTMAGVCRADICQDGQVALAMPDAFGMRLQLALNDGVVSDAVHFVQVGVPHVVIFVDDLAGADVTVVGRHVRWSHQFAPSGTNVNFVRVLDHHRMEIRTYERGVENETLACGTGSCASAIVARHLLLAESPVRLRTASGDILTVNFEPTDDGATKIVLMGGAEIVFKGELMGEN